MSAQESKQQPVMVSGGVVEGAKPQKKPAKEGKGRSIPAWKASSSDFVAQSDKIRKRQPRGLERKRWRAQH